MAERRNNAVSGDGKGPRPQLPSAHDIVRVKGRVIALEGDQFVHVGFKPAWSSSGREEKVTYFVGSPVNKKDSAVIFDLFPNCRIEFDYSWKPVLNQDGKMQCKTFANNVKVMKSDDSTPRSRLSVSAAPYEPRKRNREYEGKFRKQHGGPNYVSERWNGSERKNQNKRGQEMKQPEIQIKEVMRDRYVYGIQAFCTKKDKTRIQIEFTDEGKIHTADILSGDSIEMEGKITKKMDFGKFQVGDELKIDACHSQKFKKWNLLSIDRVSIGQVTQVLDFIISTVVKESERANKKSGSLSSEDNSSSSEDTSSSSVDTVIDRSRDIIMIDLNLDNDSQDDKATNEKYVEEDENFSKVDNNNNKGPQTETFKISELVAEFEPRIKKIEPPIIQTETMKISEVVEASMIGNLIDFNETSIVNPFEKNYLPSEVEKIKISDVVQTLRIQDDILIEPVSTPTNRDVGVQVEMFKDPETLTESKGVQVGKPPRVMLLQKLEEFKKEIQSDSSLD